MVTMTSKKPYLIRAFYDWIVDNGLTPYLLVNAKAKGVEVPQDYVSDGRIILNISPKLCQGLHIENDRILFTTSFKGLSTQVFLTPGSILAIYAKENREGIEFSEEDEPPPPPEPEIGGKMSRKPSLKLVK